MLIQRERVSLRSELRSIQKASSRVSCNNGCERIFEFSYETSDIEFTRGSMFLSVCSSVLFAVKALSLVPTNFGITWASTLGSINQVVWTFW